VFVQQNIQRIESKGGWDWGEGYQGWTVEGRESVTPSRPVAKHLEHMSIKTKKKWVMKNVHPKNEKKHTCYREVRFHQKQRRVFLKILV